MTSNSDKLRSLILAALMVFSVFAGTVALSGSAAAANNASFVSVTNTEDIDGDSTPDVSDDQTRQHTLTFEVDDVSADGNTDTISLTLPGGASFESADGITVVNRANGQQLDVTGSPSLSDTAGTTDDTVSFDISPDTNNDNVDSDPVDIRVSATFTANWPDVTAAQGSVSGPVTLDVTDSRDSDITGQELATLEIIDSTEVSEEETPLQSGATFYGGQEVFVTGLDAGETYQVRTVNDEDGDDSIGALRRTLTADNGVLSFELDGRLSEGDFVVTDGAGTSILIDENGVGTPGSNNAEAEQFEVVTQDLTAEFDDASVGNDGSGDTTLVDYEISSDVRTDYNVNISASGLDVDDLNDIFGDDETINEFEDDDTVTVDGDREYELDFTDIDADTYTFEANVTDTTASDSDDIEVTDTGDADASFGDNVFLDQRGDLVNITVEMDNTDTATVQVGDDEESGYSIVAQVEDDDDDGVAYVEFNSFYAGSGDLSTVLTAGDDDTSVSERELGDDAFDDNTPVGSDLLDAGDYELYVVEGDKTDNDITTSDFDFNRGTLTLQEPSVDNAQVWTTPADALSDLQSADAEDIPAWANAGNLTQADTIADGDGLIVQVDASGLEGAFVGDDNAATYEAITTADGSTIAEDLVSLTFESEGQLNQGDDDGVTISDIGTDNFDVIYDGSNDAHYVVIDSAALTGAQDSDEFTANFTVDDDNTDFVDDDVSVTDEFGVDDPELELDTNADDEIVLQNAAGQEVTGDTNLAPGTEVEVSLDSDTSGDPFVKRPEATVQADGTFTAVVDFSENNAGSEFTATATVGNLDVDSDDYDGRLVDAPPQPVTDTPEPDTDTPDTDTPDTPDTDTPEPDTDTATPMPDTDTAEETTTADENETDATATGGSGPGFTAALALIALVAAALLAVRRNN